jgi:hypothetical protein
MCLAKMAGELAHDKDAGPVCVVSDRLGDILFHGDILSVGE